MPEHGHCHSSHGVVLNYQKEWNFNANVDHVSRLCLITFVIDQIKFRILNKGHFQGSLYGQKLKFLYYNNKVQKRHCVSFNVV